VGCGHGLFGNLLALQSPRRSVVGVDPSPAKIAVARRAARGLPNARYAQGTIHDVSDGPFDAITILDVLYLLPLEEKRRLLARARALLAPGGVLVLKTNDTTPRWSYLLTRAQERLMTGVGLTLGDGLHFLSAGEHLELLRATGFEARVAPLPGWSLHPHRLFVCRAAACSASGGGR